MSVFWCFLRVHQRRDGLNKPLGIFQLGCSSMTSTSTINRTPSCPGQRDGAPDWPSFLRCIMRSASLLWKPQHQQQRSRFKKKKWPEITLASILVTTGPTTTTELLDHWWPSHCFPAHPHHLPDRHLPGMQVMLKFKQDWRVTSLADFLGNVKLDEAGWSWDDNIIPCISWNITLRADQPMITTKNWVSHWSFSLEGFDIPQFWRRQRHMASQTWGTGRSYHGPKVVVALTISRFGTRLVAPHLLHRDPFTPAQEDHANIALHDGLKQLTRPVARLLVLNSTSRVGNCKKRNLAKPVPSRISSWPRLSLSVGGQENTHDLETRHGLSGRWGILKHCRPNKMGLQGIERICTPLTGEGWDISDTQHTLW